MILGTGAGTAITGRKRVLSGVLESRVVVSWITSAKRKKEGRGRNSARETNTIVLGISLPTKTVQCKSIILGVEMSMG